jgi:hypothetical protein
MSDCRRTSRGKADVSGPLCSHHLNHYVIFAGREIRLAFRVTPCNSTACHLTQRERIVLPGFCSDHGTRRRRAHDPKRIISRVVPWERFWSAQEAVSNSPSSPARSTAAVSRRSRASVKIENRTAVEVTPRPDRAMSSGRRYRARARRLTTEQESATRCRKTSNTTAAMAATMKLPIVQADRVSRPVSRNHLPPYSRTLVVRLALTGQALRRQPRRDQRLLSLSC